MNSYLRCIFIFFIILLLTVITSCGFQLRGTHNLPPQLNTLYLDIEKPDSPFSQAVRALLLSLHINLTTTAAQAPYVLHVSYTFTHSTPNITSTTQTVSYSFRLRVRSSITTNQGQPIVPTRTTNMTQSLVMNSNEIYIPNTANLVETQLTRNAINLLFFWLTDKNTRIALATNGAQTEITSPVATPASTTSAASPASASPIPTTTSAPASINDNLPASLPPIPTTNPQPIAPEAPATINSTSSS